LLGPAGPIVFHWLTDYKSRTFPLGEYSR